MVIKVGINGFGRIGRVVFRTCLENSEIQVCAINDPGISVVYISYLIKFDTTHGKFKGTVSHSQKQVIVDGRPIEVFHEKLPKLIPWDVAEIKYVIETSGMFTSVDNAAGHLERRGVSRVLVTAPSVDIPMYVLGVNGQNISPDIKVVSCASSTLYCLAPIVKILDDNFGLEEGFVTSIRAMTPSFQPLDGMCVRDKLFRNHRCIHQNITPAKTGVCLALAKVLPETKGKLKGTAFKIPVVNVSMLDLTVRLTENTSLLDIIQQVEEKGRTTMKNLIKTSRQGRNSSNYIGESHSCILDILSSIEFQSNFFKLICWYENDYSYACRIIETIQMFEREWQKQIFYSKMDTVRPLLPVKIKRKNDFKSEISVQSNSNRDYHYKIHSTKNVTDLKKKWSATEKQMASPLDPETSKTNCSNDDSREKNEVKNCSNNSVETVAADKVKQDRSIRHRHNSFIQHCTIADLKNPYRPSVTEKQMVSPLVSKTTNTNFSNDDNTEKNEGKNCSNDSSKSIASEIVKQDRSIQHMHNFFRQHCTIDVSDQQIQTDLIQSKTLIRLETVRKELSKMVNITEDLLKKSLSPKINAKPASKILKKSTDGINKLYKESIYKVTMPFPLLQKYLNDSFDNRSTDSVGKPSKTKENIDLDQYQDPADNIPENIYYQLSASSISLEKRKSPKSELFSIEDVSDFDRSITRTDYSETKNSDIEEIKTDRDDINQSENFGTVLEKTTESDNILTVDCNPESNKDAIPTEDTPFREEEEDDNNFFNESKQYFPLIIKQIDKRSDKNANRNGKKENKTKTCYKNKNAANKYEDFMKDIEFESAIVSEGKFPCSTKPQKIQSNPSTVSTISTKGFSVERKDIYDKLESDSVQASDSYNSFEIRKKSSEIISISELTQSVEDLDNINKICRIIEISDELSDKLFLPLSKQSKEDDTTSKKWSLKNLCQRIKLDEFCNQVFGK